MAEAIDELLIQLGFRDEFSAKAKKASDNIDKLSGNVEKANKKGAQSLGAAGKAFKGFHMIAVGAIVAITSAITGQLVRNLTKMDIALHRSGENLNMTGKQFKSLADASKFVGGQGGEFTAFVDKLSGDVKRLELFGESFENLGLFSQLGVNIDNLGKGGKLAVNELLKVADQFEKMDYVSGKALAEQIGMSAPVFEMFKKGRAELERYLRKSEEANKIYDANASKAQLLDERFTKLGIIWDNFKISLMHSLIPVVERFTAKLEEWSDWINKNHGKIKSFTDGVAKWFANVDLKAVALFATIGKFIGFTNPILAIASALYLIYTNFDLIKEKAHEVWTCFKNVITDTFSPWIDAIRDFFNGDWDGAKAKIDEIAKADAENINRIANYQSSEAEAMGITYDEPKAVSSGKERSTLKGGLEVLATAVEKGESEKYNYDAFNRGTTGKYAGTRGSMNTSRLTIGEYLRRSKLSGDDKDKLFAIGRYQIVPDTMREMMKHAGLTERDYLTPTNQDKLFEAIITKKRPEIGKYLSGKGSLEKAIEAASAEWASLKGVNGKGKYDSKHNKAKHDIAPALIAGRVANSKQSTGTAMPSVEVAKNQSKIASSNTVSNIDNSTTMTIQNVNIQTSASTQAELIEDIRKQAQLNNQMFSSAGYTKI